MLRDEATKKYKISSHDKIVEVNQESLKLVEKFQPGLETRVEVFSQSPAFITVKDHKQGFPSKVEVRMINPAKPQTGKITKIILQEINSNLRSLTKLNQLQSTQDAISWFKSLNLKNRRLSLGFDICSFHPNISESVLEKAFTWA